MRSKWKGPFIDQTFLKISHFNLKKKRTIGWNVKKNEYIVKSRRSTILPFLNKTTAKIYSGKKYILMNIKDYHIGNKFGDFILTKSRCVYRKKNIKKKS